MKYEITEEQFRYIQAVANQLHSTSRPSMYCKHSEEIPGMHNLGRVLVGIEQGLAYWLATVKQNVEVMR
jgi:hypothetical protein